MLVLECFVSFSLLFQVVHVLHPSSDVLSTVASMFIRNIFLMLKKIDERENDICAFDV